MKVTKLHKEKEKDRQLYQRYGVFGDHLQQLGDNKHGQFYSNNNLLDSLGIDFDCLSNQVFIANVGVLLVVTVVCRVVWFVNVWKRPTDSVGGSLLPSNCPIHPSWTTQLL